MKYLNNFVLSPDYVVVAKLKLLPPTTVILADNKMAQEVFQIVNNNGIEKYSKDTFVIAKGLNAMKLPFLEDHFIIPHTDILAQYTLSDIKKL